MSAETSMKWKRRGGANFYLNKSYVIGATKISQSHTARNCPIQRTCKICAGKHPSGLHGFKVTKRRDNLPSNNDKTSETIKSNCANISNIQCAVTGSS